MCKFCDDLEYRSYMVSQRTTSADDNVCEIASPWVTSDGEVVDYISDCSDCRGCAKENMQS